MYDHVTEFKEKLVEILVEIQGMGVIDETGRCTHLHSAITAILHDISFRS